MKQILYRYFTFPLITFLQLQLLYFLMNITAAQYCLLTAAFVCSGKGRLVCLSQVRVTHNTIRLRLSHNYGRQKVAGIHYLSCSPPCVDCQTDLGMDVWLVLCYSESKHCCWSGTGVSAQPEMVGSACPGHVSLAAQVCPIPHTGRQAQWIRLGINTAEAVLLARKIISQRLSN